MIQKQHNEGTGNPYQTLVHVDSETAVEVISDENGWRVNRFRNGEGWEEIHTEEYHSS